MFVAEESPNVARKKDAANRVNDLPRGNFMLFYDPTDWAVDFRGRLMPTVVHLSRSPGAGAVAANGDFTFAEAEYRQRGYVPIPHDVLGDEADYVALYRNRKGAAVHRTIFQAGYQSSPKAPTEWEFDQEAWDAFIQLLRRKGLIKPPRPEVIRGLLDRQRQLLATKKAPRTDDGAALERHNEKLARCKTAIATLEEELAASTATYGEAQSPGRHRILALLREQVDEADETEAAAAPLRARAGRRAKPPKPGKGLVADDTETVADDDEEDLG